jgi:hypothetical protein
LHSNRLNNPYRRDLGRSNPGDESMTDLAGELGRLLDRTYERHQKHERPRDGRVAHDGHYSLRSVLAKNDAKLAARRGTHNEYSQSRDRYYHAPQFDDAEKFRGRDEPLLRAERDDGDYFDRYAAQGPYEEEMYESPHQRQRGGLVTALVLIGWAMVGTAGAYAYRTYYVAPSSTKTSPTPSQAKLAQPGVRGAPPAAASGSGYVVQVSAQRSKADAEASFRSLQEKFPGQLGARTAIIRRVDLGTKGIYYRAFVGPFPSAGDADQFCGKFKTAGGQCFVQRN